MATDANAAKVKSTDTKPGKGEAAVEGDTVWVSYVGKLTNGKEFDSSAKTGRPYKVTIGAGQVIKGWDQGLVGVKEGMHRKLEIPYQLAYGEAGSGDTIPPNADLVFDIDVHTVLKPADAAVIKSTPLKEGTGPAIADGDTVTMDYTIKLVNDVVVDTTIKKDGKPFTFTVGNRETITGIDAGVVGLKAGSEQLLFIPPKLGLAYGGATVPPQSPLIAEIEIRKVVKGKPKG